MHPITNIAPVTLDPYTMVTKSYVDSFSGGFDEIEKRLSSLESRAFIYHPELHKDHPALEHAFNALSDAYEQYELIRAFVTSKGK